ncbi:2-C-methyl-D-erythritol 4-phosphate cytidylyltransferase, partial [Rhizobium ruizarguesonis]
SATPIETVHGGASRQQSVLACLRYLKDKQISHVLIHDALRPFFDHDLLDRIAESLDAGALDGRGGQDRRRSWRRYHRHQ